jgi:hypothetical protein
VSVGAGVGVAGGRVGETVGRIGVAVDRDVVDLPHPAISKKANPITII